MREMLLNKLDSRGGSDLAPRVCHYSVELEVIPYIRGSLTAQKLRTCSSMVCSLDLAVICMSKVKESVEE